MLIPVESGIFEVSWAVLGGSKGIIPCLNILHNCERHVFLINLEQSNSKMPFQVMICIPPLKYFDLQSCVIIFTCYTVLEQENLSTHSAAKAHLK